MALQKFECPHCEAVCELFGKLPTDSMVCVSCKKAFLVSQAIAVLQPTVAKPIAPDPPKVGLDSFVSLDKAALGLSRTGKHEINTKTTGLKKQLDEAPPGRQAPNSPINKVPQEGGASSVNSKLATPATDGQAVVPVLPSRKSEHSTSRPALKVSLPSGDSKSASSNVSIDVKSEIEIEPQSKTIITEFARNRKKRQFGTFVVSNAILAIAILALIGWLVLRLISGPPESPESVDATLPKLFDQSPVLNDPADPSVSDSSVSKADQFADSGEADSEETGTSETAETAKQDPPQQVVPPSPPPQPTFAFHSPKQVAEIWKLAKPNIVSLDIEGPLGKSRGVGTIVDSRGWIVTSHQAVKDAWKIEVTAALNPLDQNTVEPPLQDLVRGHVISDPAGDLAVLAVNRRFVISLAQLRLGEHDRIVAESRLVAAAPPGEPLYYGVSEIKIEKRGPVSELPQEVSSKIESWNIGVIDKPWFQVFCSNQLLPGTPLFDSDGRYQAMVSFSKQKYGYAVAIDKLPALLKRAGGNISPLKTPSLKTESGDLVVVSNEHPVRQRMIKLSKLGTNCDDFNYIPSTKEQYIELTEFLKEYQSARQYLKVKVRDYRDAPENLAADDALVESIKEWEQKVIVSLQDLKVTGDERIKQINSMGRESLGQPKAFVPLLARVDDGVFQMDEFRVEVLETDYLLSIPHNSKGKRLMPGSFWLLLMETNAEKNQKRVKLPDGKTKKLIAVDLRAQFGPIAEK